jgi:hypothetical protein
MLVLPILQLTPNPSVETAVAGLLRLTETAEIVRWIEFPQSVLLFLIVPEDPASGAAYVFDRKNGIWYFVDFNDEHYGGYTVEQLESLLTECRFLRLVEQPWLFSGEVSWVVEPGRNPEAKI